MTGGGGAGDPGWGPPGAAPPGVPTGWQPPAAPAAAAAPPGWRPPPGAPPAPPKPGVVPLRPLGPVEILDGAQATIRAYPRTMLLPAAVVAIVAQLAQVLLAHLLLRDVSIDLTVDDTSGASPDPTYLGATLLNGGLATLLTLLATILLTGLLTVTVGEAVLGRPVATGEAWRRTRPRLPAVAGATLLVLVAQALALSLPLLPAVLAALAGAPAGAVVVLVLAGVPVALAAAAYLYVTWALVTPAVVLERQPLLRAFGRSRRLVRGAWWRTFGLLVLVTVVIQVVAGVLATPFLVAGFVVAALGGDGSLDLYALAPLAITAVGQVLAATLTWPFAAASTALIYIDRRMRREALDLELARAAGLAVPGSTATPGTLPT